MERVELWEVWKGVEAGGRVKKDMKHCLSRGSKSKAMPQVCISTYTTTMTKGLNPGESMIHAYTAKHHPSPEAVAT